ncbi:MAG: penicillin acylase family protein [Bryobacteraceae bacterium]
MPRIVRWINLTIAVLLGLGAAAVYWYAWRPLPQVSGSVKAPVAQEVAVARDALGVPHISAASLDDALFAQGYVTAQERLWQMDALRRLAAGELAEVIGPAGLAADRDARRLRMRRIAEQVTAGLAEDDRAALAAYARGVNHFIGTHRAKLPVEFSLLGYDPHPWSGVDSILIGLQMYSTLTTTWKMELAKANMLASGDRAKVDLLWAVPGASGALLPGSNAWVLAGSRTASGKPLLANDPHLEYSLPGIWFMTHLRAPGVNVSGVSIPGMPGVIIGHNERIAWGMTNLGFDVQDLYVERIDPRTGKYEYRGAAVQARAEREFIRVKGGETEEMLVWVTRHGPLFVNENGRQMALKWVAAEPGGVGFPFLRIGGARNWSEFTAALERFAGPGSNFVYADVDGNIGYHAAGRLPIRRTFGGDVPVDGASGEFEWEGFVPFRELPAEFNPPGGVIVSANQDPFPPRWPYKAGGDFAAPYRARQIGRLLRSRGKWQAQDMLAVQKDVYSEFSHFLAREIVAAYDRLKARNPELADAIALLRAWNGQMDRELAAPLVVTLAYQHFRRAAAQSAAPGKGPVYDTQVATSALERLLRERPAGWFENYDRALLAALQDGVEEGRRIERRDVRRWSYGDYARLRLAHPVFHRVPWAGKYFDIGPVPFSGSGTTVKQTTARLGPSMRMDADLSDWDRSWMNVVAGQSGHPLSPHYRDQWEHYDSGRSYPMQFNRIDAKQVLYLRP